MKLNDGFIGICNSFFPQYLINAIFEGDFQPVNPDKFSLSKSNLYVGLNIIYLNEFISVFFGSFFEPSKPEIPETVVYFKTFFLPGFTI